jgi:predicted GNAT superfamily acetyltransferase
MASSAPPAASKEFQFRRLQKPEEFRAAEEVARGSGLAEEPPPTPLLREIQDNGGLVVGAFAEIYLAGFSAGFLGWDGTKLYHHSYQTAVRPEYQNHRLGYRLKLWQREEMLRQGLDEIRWTFDPLLSRNAHLFVRRLGATPEKYLVHYFGHIVRSEREEVESDRILLRWRLSEPDVAARLEPSAPPSDRAADERRFAASTPVVETETDEHGLRVPSAVQEPSADSAHLEVPFDLALIREHSPGSLRAWRHATRDAFRAAFDTGYLVDDFAVVSPDHERRSVYFLRKRPAPAAA